MGIIDTHIHIWDLERIEYAWLKGNTSLLNRTYLIDELNEEHQQIGITQGVLVQAANNFEDTDWMLAVASNSKWVDGVVGWLPLTDPVAVQNALDAKYLKNPIFKGVRHLIHDEPDSKWLLQNSVLESLEVLAQHNYSYDIVGVLPEHIETALRVAEKIPTLRMVFDHLNQPPIKGNERFGRWGELMREASAHKNFHVKISGLGTTSGKTGNAWTANDIRPYVDFALQHYGTDRCFCGGDWPVSLLAGDYTYSWKVYQSMITMLTKEDQEKVLYWNAKAFYNL